MQGEVEVAVGSDAVELLSNVVDYGLAAVVRFRFAQPPGLVIPDHGVELVDSSDENELRVFEDFGVSNLV